MILGAVSIDEVDNFVGGVITVAGLVELVDDFPSFRVSSSLQKEFSRLVQEAEEEDCNSEEDHWLDWDYPPTWGS